MADIKNIKNPWRVELLAEKASFRGVKFHVESGSLSSGRRTVVHEYPKRNEPYAEDMGRHAKRFAFTGYLIYRVNPPPGMATYTVQRDRLIAKLNEDDAGVLVHPVFAKGGMLVMCERYSVTDSRERGGFSQFEMQFVDATGKPGNSNAAVDTNGNVAAKATDAEASAKAGMDQVTADEAQRRTL